MHSTEIIHAGSRSTKIEPIDDTDSTSRMVMLEEWIVRLDESYTALKAQASRMDEELQELRKICRVEVRPLQPESELFLTCNLKKWTVNPEIIRTVTNRNSPQVLYHLWGDSGQM